MTAGGGGSLEVVGRLERAMNAHDLEASLELFTEDYASEQPAHPDRAFGGREQVRANWGAIFAGVPDLRVEVVRAVAGEDTAWAEWRWHGTQRGGAPMDVRGVTIFGVRDGRIAWARLFMEPVERGGEGIEAAVEDLAGRRPGPAGQGNPD